MEGVSAVFQVIPIVKDFFDFQVRIKVIGEPPEENRDQKVLEVLPKYLVSENLSKKRLPPTTLETEFLINENDSLKKTEKLGFLNPNEHTKILFGIRWLIDERPDLFERTTEGDTTKVTPKEPMKVVIKLKVKLHGHLEIQKDEYYMEFGSLKNYPHWKDHPVILVWNKRGENYIYKN